MKNILKMLNLILVFILLSSVSCDGNDQQEIPTGNHSFYCYIDGELFVPRGNPNITTTPSDDGLRISITDSFYQIEAHDYSKYVIFINIKDINSEIIHLNESTGSFYDYNNNHAFIRKNGVKYLSKENSGTITFTENTQNDVKGTFEFTLYNENDDSDVIHVTNGHFDD